VNLSLNFSGTPGFVYEAPPMCVQEYAVGTALRLGWVLFIMLLLNIIYQGRVRPRVAERIGEKWACAIDNGLFIAYAGVAGVILQALRMVAG
jgi:hypothetical protein